MRMSSARNCSVTGQVGRELVEQAGAAAGPLFGPVAVKTLEVIAAQVQADRGVEQVGFGEVDHVARDLRTGRGLDAKLLARSAECAAAAEVLPTARQALPVEVLLVQDDRADHAGIRVDAGAEHELAGLGFGRRDKHVQAAGPPVAAGCSKTRSAAPAAVRPAGRPVALHRAEPAARIADRRRVPCIAAAEAAPGHRVAAERARRRAGRFAALHTGGAIIGRRGCVGLRGAMRWVAGRIARRPAGRPGSPCRVGVRGQTG